MIKRVYDVCPSGVQSALVSFYGYLNDRRRYSYPFKQCRGELLENDSLSSEELRAYQKKKLQAFLRHSVKSSFWESRFRKYGVDVDGDPYEQISKLPILNKEEVRDKVDEIHIPRKGSYNISTSGSTGTGLKFWGDRNSEAFQWAVWWRYWSRFGIKRGMWSGHFGGKAIVPINNKNPPFFRTNYASNQVVFSAYHLSPSTVGNYVSAINKKRLLWLHGYPSVISELARLAVDQGLKLDHAVSWISLGSENVTSSHVRAIRNFFGVDPIQHYGLAEGVANFSQRPSSDQLVVDEDFSYVEFVSNGDQFKTVGTNFSNYTFPLFRYDTGDLVSSVDETNFPRFLGSIDGRGDDVIQLPDGRRVGRVAQVFNDVYEVDEAQLVQKSVDKVLVRLVKNSKWTVSSESKILNNLRGKLGCDIDIIFEHVGSVARTAAGKVRFVISEV